ncbi:hypothetical protein FKM82_025776 [Ascaphus truei]
MGWPVLVLFLCLSGPRVTCADCVSECISCVLQIRGSDIHINPLVCSLQCEGSLLSTAEWERCAKVLYPFGASSLGEGAGDAKREQERVPPPSDPYEGPAKRYGGFLKKLDKSKLLYASPQRENANAKSEASKKYGGFLRKYGERDLLDPPADPEQDAGSPVSEEQEGEEQGWGGMDERKRYGGFLRKYPKRSPEPAWGPERDDLQKRYGGFMRRIRPKLKWDNEKRYGGFLRRQYKVTARSEEEPSTFSGELSDL